MTKVACRQKGFTITELSLAMSLIGVLMFILLLSSMNFVNIYNKGITLKRVNQSGANIALELQANLRRSSEITPRTTTVGPDTFATGVCTGTYSFVWSVYASGDGSGSQPPKVELRYANPAPENTTVFFAKVRDPTKEMCSASPPAPYKGNCPVGLSPCYQSTELLGDGLVVRDPTPTNDDKGGLNVILSPDKKLATVIYTISTNGGEDIINDTTDRAGCQGGKEYNFCALNTFVVTAYAKGVYN